MAYRFGGAGYSPEPIIEPDLPIVDAHHHLWIQSEADLRGLAAMHGLAAPAVLPNYSRNARYLLDDYLADARTGHDIRATVFVEAHTMYRKSGPQERRSLGEVEFATGAAAMCASGNFGDVRVAGAIVGGGFRLSLGDAAEELLQAHVAAAGGRYRGFRDWALYDSDPSILGEFAVQPQLLLDARFRAGFRHLQPLGLSFDVFVLEPQLAEVLDLARAFPDTRIILNHLGGPLGVGQYRGGRQQRFPIWRDSIRALSKCPNVSIKLSGLGTFLWGFGHEVAATAPTSQQLAKEWRPYIEVAIEAFGASRSMFASNFPVDDATCSFPVLWNAFKRITSGASDGEKKALYSGTATRVYRLDTD